MVQSRRVVCDRLGTLGWTASCVNVDDRGRDGKSVEHSWAYPRGGRMLHHVSSAVSSGPQTEP